VTTAAPGGSVTYTITATNNGPSDANGATVADTFDGSLTCTWTCTGTGTCAATGNGDIGDTVNLPANGSVTYTASCTIDDEATGTLSNTATVDAPDGVTDTDASNNSATDTDTLEAQADLSITKTDGVDEVLPGDTLTYTIVVSNAGPSPAPASHVTDSLPAALTCTWTCEGSGATCRGAGDGDIDETVDLPAGSSVTYTLTCDVEMDATGYIDNTASVAAGAGVTDPVPGNNTATDSDALPVLFRDGFETGDTSEWEAQEPAGLVRSGTAKVTSGSRATLSYDFSALPATFAPGRVVEALDRDGHGLFAVETRRTAPDAPLEVRLVALTGEGQASDWQAVAERRQELRLGWRAGAPGGGGGSVELAIEGRAALWLEGIALDSAPAVMRTSVLRVAGDRQR